jgi:hypothetical protein
MRAPLLLALAAMGCGERPVPPPNRVTVTTTATTDHTDTSTTTLHDDGPPTAGTAEDVIGRVFDLGSAPSIPTAFGKLRPGMSRAQATHARPSAWGDSWSGPGPESGVTLSASDDDDPVGHLTVELTQRDAAARLATAWGTPALTAYHGGTVCWLSPTAKLKACHEKDLDHDAIELATYRPLADSLSDQTCSPTAATALLGKDKSAVSRAFPHAQELSDPKDATKHRMEVQIPGTEYSADVGGDSIEFFLDDKDKVIAAHLRYGASDPNVRPKLVEAVKEAANAVKGGGDLLVTVREEDKAEVVVVLDSSPGLQ